MKYFSWCLSTFAILGIAIHPVFAQSNYQTGTLLQLNGDSVNGYISFRNAARNPTKIYFKPGESGEITTYTPLEIKGFRLGSTSFVSGMVRVNEEPFEISRPLRISPIIRTPFSCRY